MLNNLFKITGFIFVVLIVNKVAFLVSQPTSSLLSEFNTYLAALGWGLRFDLSALIILTLPIAIVLLFNPPVIILRILIVLNVLWISLTTLSDTVYLLESTRHVTFEVFNSEGSIAGLVLTLFTQYLTYSLLAILLIVLFSYLAFKLRLDNNKKSKVIIRSSVFVIWLLAGITIVRGGWVDSPQSPMSIFNIGDNQKAMIAWSAPYTISYYLIDGQKYAAKKITSEPTEAEKQLVISTIADRNKQFQAPQKQANIIVVLLESWRSIDLLDEVAPNFLAQKSQSLSTQHFFANGYRTVEGIFSTFCSYPNPINGGISGTQLLSFEYQCLPHLLKDYGWQTHFIQGSNKGIVGSYAQSVGFEYSYGKNDYKFEGVENNWGFMDDAIFQFSLDIIEQAKPPYLITINTGTNHDENLPAGVDYKFGKETSSERRLSVTHDSDKAVGKFIKNLEKVLTEPTLVVFVADHTVGVSEPLLKRNAVPFLIYANDDSIKPELKPINAGQFDIAPTIIDWLGGNVPWFVGSSLLADEYQGFMNYSYGTTIGWIQDNVLINFDAANTENSSDCYEIQSENLEVTPTTCEPYKSQKDFAKAFTKYTQSLLFSGQTKNYGE